MNTIRGWDHDKKTSFQKRAGIILVVFLFMAYAGLIRATVEPRVISHRPDSKKQVLIIIEGRRKYYA
ncbi:MAG: hypothetical protein GY797_31925 [Deltaproteobacteria bacterium]|nr:hypothetical protein [Deltaproteobacteria bacterium]